MTNPNTAFLEVHCSHCRLTTLEGGPQIVRNDFNCSINDITTLYGEIYTKQ